MAIVKRVYDSKTSFQVKVKDQNGNWFPSPSFDREEDARTEEARLFQLKSKGVQAISQDAKRFTFQEYWEVWSVENRADVSAGWKITQNQMYRDYLEPILGKLKLRDLGAPEIGRVLNRAQEMGRGESTRLQIYTLMHTMFQDAVEYYEMVAASPVKAKLHRPKVKRQERKFLPPEVSWAFLLEVKSHHYLGPPAWLGLLAGLRKEVVQALLWPAVHWDLNEILICRAFKAKEKVIADYPKGRDWERVPMVPALKDYLRETFGKRADKEGFICLGPKGGMLSYNTYYPALKKFCQDKGFPVVTPHELRHSCSELFVRAGATQEDIRRLLNHKDASTTRIYMHRTDERTAQIAQSVKPVGFPEEFPEREISPVCVDSEEVRIVH